MTYTIEKSILTRRNSNYILLENCCSWIDLGINRIQTTAMHFRFRFSVRVFLIFVGLVCTFLGWRAYRVNKVETAVRSIREVGGWTRYRYAYTETKNGRLRNYDCDLILTAAPFPRQHWIKVMIGDSEHNNVDGVILSGTRHNSDRGWYHALTCDDELLSKLAPHLNALDGLKILDLSQNPLTAEGLRHLQELHGLEELNLLATEVDDAGLRHLEAIKSLRKVDLVHTRVTPDGVRRLEEALPNCNVRHW